MVPVAERPSQLLAKAMGDVTWDGPAATVSTSMAPGSPYLQALQSENQELKNTLKEMMARLQDLELRNKQVGESQDKRSRTLARKNQGSRMNLRRSKAI